MMVGMVAGHFTEEEFAFFVEKEPEVRRRLIDLCILALQDQVNDLTDKLKATEKLLRETRTRVAVDILASSCNDIVSWFSELATGDDAEVLDAENYVLRSYEAAKERFQHSDDPIEDALTLTKHWDKYLKEKGYKVFLPEPPRV
ncbi:MAG: hypothetical protein IH820_13770 [Bacteroidetes bacterium]|nr:hypothetical protein [Bacteroidota bacterium]